MSNKKLPQREKRTCKICNKEFKTSLVDKIYCSDKCMSMYRAKNLQRLFDEGKITPNKVCEEAFYNITNLMKNLIAVELVRKGYWKNGVLQTNFGDEELLDCYIFVMDHVFGNFIKRSGKSSYVKYDPSRINKRTGENIFLASFINTWTRGWCSLTKQTQENAHKRDKHIVFSLDEITETYTPEELIEKEFVDNINRDIYNDLEEKLYNELEDIYIDFT